MLEGLEISEIKYSYVRKNGEVFRFDSNYFLKKFIDDESLIRTRRYSTIKGIGAELKSFGAYSLNNDVHYLESGVPFIRGINMKKGRISFNDMIFIDETANSLLWKSEVKPEMVLLSMSGTIGDVAIASKKWEYPINSNQDIAKIETLGKINPYFLYAFLSSKFGQNYLIREARGSVQQHVFLSQMEQFEIPLLNERFIQSIQSSIEKSDEFQYLAEDLYKNAETLLLETLGLNNFEPSTDGVNVKSYKESFLATGRIDSEYYQKRYDILENHFDSFDRKRIGDFITNPVASGVTPKAGGDDYSDSESGIPFIRAVDLKNGEVTTENFIYIKPEIHNGILKRTQLKKGDVLFSIAGTVGRCSLFDHSFEANINQAVSILRFDDKFIKRLYLIVFFNSEIGKEFVSRYSRQGVQTNLNLAEVADLRVPIIEYTKQKKIAALIEESFRLKKQSEQLLETAKRAVEIAIEEDEEVAIDYINAQVQQLS
ncbi:MAG: restriction endonuclease subunit S [Bacteroidia bacterium]|nr:restriction endonuclease subunit S [Bacteroidia bacterium]